MKSNPSGTANAKKMSYKSRKRETERLLALLQILTPNARERWAILTTMLETTIEKIKSGKERPILLRPWELKDRGSHKVGSIRNAINLLTNISPPVLMPHEEELPFCDLKITKEGISYLYRELEIWDAVKEYFPVDTLTLCDLEVVRKVLDELNRLFEGPIPKKT